MNTVNQVFDWSRFTAALRKEVVENSRALLFTILCIYGLLTLIMILGNLTTHSATNVADALADKMPQVMVGSIMTVVVCVAASMSFMNLRTKTGRTSMMTSPSSTFEKFLVNVLIYIVGLVVAFFACAQLADLTRIAALWFFRGDNFVVPGPINFLTCISDIAKVNVPTEVTGLRSMGVITILGLIANAGMYLLGSVVWPRLSFLKTFAVLYAIEFCLFLIVAPLFYFFGDFNSFMTWLLNFVMNNGFSISMLIFVCVEIVLFFGLAWYLFKRKDVISLKWWK